VERIALNALGSLPHENQRLEGKTLHHLPSLQYANLNK
jgi:hypothetical protein